MINVSHLGLEHEGEPIVEIDPHDRRVTTLFRGVRTLSNYWDMDDLDPSVAERLRQVIGRTVAPCERCGS